MNALNRDVFLSILALDAYNRGYGQNVDDLSAEGQIGTANILGDALSELDADDVIAAGFYAIAYAWNGETVISFRGTNVASPAAPVWA